MRQDGPLPQKSSSGRERASGHRKQKLYDTSGEENSSFRIDASAHREIVSYLKKVRFKHRLFGGVDEVDVWKKIERLNELYEAALRAERIRYDALLQEQKDRMSFEPKEKEGDC